ncbi:MAG: glycoside hydrolase family 3 protein [Deltaproteobacteria bacterium]|nr:glycoside hydrolase family 3 protein [Deltaproteobacteria bacterium]MCB9487512.1 glycoside hydrolase family 3 protein [Deltaproteobacteria bacterium]
MRRRATLFLGVVAILLGVASLACFPPERELDGGDGVDTIELGDDDTAPDDDTVGDDDTQDDDSDDDDDLGDDDDDASDDDTSDDDDDDDTVESPYCEVDEASIDALIDSMSLEEKIAQMYLVNGYFSAILPGSMSEETRHLVQDVGVGGVFGQLASLIGLNPKWTIKNVNAVQEAALASAHGVPVLIAVDQEGGIPQAVNNLTGGTDQPGNMGLGATFDPAATRASYDRMGLELSTMGLNVAFSPVLGVMTDADENSMYTRCFGELTDEVSAHAAQAVQGFQGQLVIAAAKHFPGQTAAPGDEHFGIVTAKQSERKIRKTYLPPFESAIDAGTDMIMPTHAVFDAFDPGVPTTFSHVMLTDLLRDELGFEGVIITDAMTMGGVVLYETATHPDLLAIQAGVDMILELYAEVVEHPDWGHTKDIEERIALVAQAVKDGDLTEERIDASVRRILRMKTKYCLFENPTRDKNAGEDVVGTQEAYDASLAMHEDVITLVRDEDGVLPLNAGTVGKVHVVAPKAIVDEMYPGAHWQNAAGTTLIEQVQAIVPSATGADFFRTNPKESEVDDLVAGAQAAKADVYIVGTYNARDNAGQQDLVERILALGKPTVVVATGMPYDLSSFDEAPVYIATYSNRDLALQAAARAIFGQAGMNGRLPVSIPGLYDAGWSAIEGTP